MSRSVSYANNSVHIEYAHIDCDDEYDFQFVLEDIQSALTRAFPSVTECDEWVGREDHAIAENRFAYFGISEYCGLISVWCTPKDTDYYSDSGFENLRDHWVDQVGKTFRKTVRSSVGTPLSLVGRFSNGEAIFQAV